jgi:regulator of extracellular matrix RemA (YlzA/DUF370 family)
MVNAEKIVAVVSPASAPMKRLVQDAREAAALVDATAGRRTRAVIISDSGHVVLSGLTPETISARINAPRGAAEEPPRSGAPAFCRAEPGSEPAPAKPAGGFPG